MIPILLKVDLWALSSLSEAVGSYAENQRITAVRRVYQRGCVNPMINIEQLWRDYSKYEEVSGRSGVAGVPWVIAVTSAVCFMNRASMFTWLKR